MTQHGATFGGTVKQKYISHMILSILPNVQVQVWERHGVCWDAGPHDISHDSKDSNNLQSADPATPPCKAAEQSHTFTAAWHLTEEASKLQGGGVVLKARPLQLGCYRSDKTEKKRGIGQTKYRDPAQERLLRSTNTHGLFSGEAGARGSQSYQCKKRGYNLDLKSGLQSRATL